MTNHKTFLGQLEKAIMDVVWDNGPRTVRGVLDALPSERQGAYTTVMTVMNRLVRQGYLRRRPTTEGAFLYVATNSRQAYSAAASRQGIHQLVKHYGDVALVQFMEKLDTIPSDKLHQLKQQLKKKNR